MEIPRVTPHRSPKLPAHYSLGWSGYANTNWESPIMKLRFLKFVYPDVDDVALFDMLYNCDHNAQRVIKKLDEMGFEKHDPAKRKRPASDAVMSYAAEGYKATTPSHMRLKFPKSRETKDLALSRLSENYTELDHNLMQLAMEACNYDTAAAAAVLELMSPQEQSKYIPGPVNGPHLPPPIKRLTKGCQTHNVIESENGESIWIYPIGDEVETSDKGTCTTEDQVVKPLETKLAKGPDPSNVVGPQGNGQFLADSFRTLAIGPVGSLRTGPQAGLAKGPSKGLASGPLGSYTRGPDPSLRSGPSGVSVKDVKKVKYVFK